VRLARYLTLLVSWIAIGFLYVPNGVASEICNRIVAVVNDEVITLYELNKKIEEMTRMSPEDLNLKDPKRYLETRRMILDLLINDRITQEKIQELEITVSERQVDETIERIKENNRWTHEDLMEKLKAEGLTYEKYRDRIKKDLERIKLINSEVKSKIIIREEEIRKFYEEHKEDLSTEGQMHLAGIFLMGEDPNDPEEVRKLTLKGQDILSRLRNGEDFAKVAREFSQGPGAKDGGDLGRFKTTQLNPELRKELESVPVGGYSDLILRPNGIQIIKVIENEKGQVKPFEEVKDAIQGILYQEEVNRRYTAWIDDLRKKSYTKIIF
jgi:peptidyl-prolyl cis-trans isomerase SurA